MIETDELVQHRLNKLARLRELDIDPYPAHFHRTHSAAAAIQQYETLPAGTESPEIVVAGRLVANRPMGKATFAHILDGSGRLQIFLKRDVLGEMAYDLYKQCDLGDFIGARGRLFRTRTGEITLEVHEFVMLAKALRPLPEKWHGLVDVEKRYRQRYLDLIANPDVKQAFILRSKMVANVRRFMDERGFVEVETPVLQAHAGGAMARPFVTHYHALDRDFYLRIALELALKRVLVGGIDKVYEIGRLFRNEGISTKHNPEFTMMESYEAYADYYDVMKMVEELVSTVALETLGTTSVMSGTETIELSPPWPRISLRQAILEHSGIDFQQFPDAVSLRDEMVARGYRVDPRMGRGKLIDELLSVAVEPKLIQPTFLIDYPIELSPLAKKKPGDPALVERFEAFAGGIEIANAFTELNDPMDQRERFRQQSLLRMAGDEETELLDEDFLIALEHGMPPAGGLGIGIDRLAMVLTNSQSIREVILFPQLRTRE